LTGLGWGMTAELAHDFAAVTVSSDEARFVALSLREAVEQDHHGWPSFRVGGKIFATLWSDERMNVMLDEGGVLTAIDSAPAASEQVWWGKRQPQLGSPAPVAIVSSCASS
jgi:hypothetical protein